MNEKLKPGLVAFYDLQKTTTAMDAIELDQ